MADPEDKERAERLAGRFGEEKPDTETPEDSETKVLSMKISESLHEQVQKKFDEIFVDYVKETETPNLKKQDFYEALIKVGIDNLGLEDLENE